MAESVVGEGQPDAGAATGEGVRHSVGRLRAAAAGQGGLDLGVLGQQSGEPDVAAHRRRDPHAVQPLGLGQLLGLGAVVLLPVHITLWPNIKVAPSNYVKVAGAYGRAAVEVDPEVTMDEGAPQVRVVSEPVEAGAYQAERRHVGEAGQVAQYQHHLLVRQPFHLLLLLAHSVSPRKLLVQTRKHFKYKLILI